MMVLHMSISRRLENILYIAIETLFTSYDNGKESPGL